MAKKAPQPNHSLEQRVRALERSLDELRKIVGDLKYELEQMREE